MSPKLRLAVRLFLLCNAIALVSSLQTNRALAQSATPTLTQLCAPKVIADQVVETPKQRYATRHNLQSPIHIMASHGQTRR